MTSVKMIGILLSLFAFTCLSSMSAMDASATLLSFAMLWQVYAWRRASAAGSYKLFNWTGFDWIFVVWVVWVALGFLVNKSDGYAAIERVVEFKWILVWYAVTAAIIFVNPKSAIIRWCCLALIMACIFAICICFVGYDPIKGKVLDKVPGSILVRTGGLYGDPMTLAHCYGIFFCFLLGCLVYRKGFDKQNRIWIVLTSFICGAAIFLTFTRGVWISLFAAALVMSALYRKKVTLTLLGLGVSAATLAFLFWNTFRLRVLYAFDPKSFDQFRWNLWKANMAIFGDHPIFGAGYGESKKLLPEYFDRLGIETMRMKSHAHNQIIYFLAGTGIVGVIIFILFNFFFLRLNFKVFKAIDASQAWHKSIALACIGAQVHFVVGGLFESNFEHAKVKYVMMFVWGSVVWLAYQYNVLVSKPAKKETLK